MLSVFHAVNGDSNPPEDAKYFKDLENSKSFFCCGANLPHTLPHRKDTKISAKNSLILKSPLWLLS